MRLLIAMLLCAGTAVAAPTIRWINRFGDPRTDQVVETLNESGTEIKVRLKDGVQTIPVRRLLEFAREGADQQDLLDARRDAAAGLNLENARKVLARYARDGKPAWTREYAAAYLVVAADRSGAKDLGARVDAFVKQYPSSRFVGLMHYTRVVREAPRIKDIRQMKRAFEEAYKKIDAAQGPVHLAFRLVMIAVHESVTREPEDVNIYDRAFNKLNEIGKERGGDLLYVALAEVAFNRAQLEYYVRIGAGTVAKKGNPVGVRDHIARLTRHTGMLEAHTELRYELFRELGRFEAASGNPKGARVAWSKAREYARKLPDPRPLRAIEATLKRAGE